LSQAVQGRSGSDVGCIGLCQLAFEIGTDFHFFDVWCLIYDVWFVDVKILIISEVGNRFSTFISCVFIPYSGLSQSRFLHVLSL
jgi:hypothetical protein